MNIPLHEHLLITFPLKFLWAVLSPATQIAHDPRPLEQGGLVADARHDGTEGYELPALALIGNSKFVQFPSIHGALGRVAQILAVMPKTSIALSVR